MLPRPLLRLLLFHRRWSCRRFLWELLWEEQEEERQHLRPQEQQQEQQEQEPPQYLFYRFRPWRDLLPLPRPSSDSPLRRKWRIITASLLLR